MTLKQRLTPAILRTLLSGTILTAASCSMMLPGPKVECDYLNRAECKQAVALALTVIRPDQGSPRVIEIGDPCRGRPCSPELYRFALERFIIVRISFENSSVPVEVSVDRRDWTAQLLDPIGP